MRQSNLLHGTKNKEKKIKKTFPVHILPDEVMYVANVENSMIKQLRIAVVILRCLLSTHYKITNKLSV